MTKPSRLKHRAVDSPLGSWTNDVWHPAHLASAVHSIWHFDGLLTLPRQRLYPHGAVQFVAHIKGRRHGGFKSGRPERYPVFCFTGLQQAPLFIESDQEACTAIGICLRPSAAYAILAIPSDETTGVIVDVHDLFKNYASELLERFYDAASAKQRLRMAARWVADRLRRSAISISPAITWAAGVIGQRRGRISIADLQTHVGMTKKQLTAAFRREVGVTPKHYARIVRFRHTLKLLHDQVDLAEAATLAGYFDQAHMNAEFRKLSGLTPGEYVAAGRINPFVSLDDPGKETDKGRTRERGNADTHVS